MGQATRSKRRIHTSGEDRVPCTLMLKPGVNNLQSQHCGVDLRISILVDEAKILQEILWDCLQADFSREMPEKTLVYTRHLLCSLLTTLLAITSSCTDNMNRSSTNAADVRIRCHVSPTLAEEVSSLPTGIIKKFHDNKIIRGISFVLWCFGGCAFFLVLCFREQPHHGQDDWWVCLFPLLTWPIVVLHCSRLNLKILRQLAVRSFIEMTLVLCFTLVMFFVLSTRLVKIIIL